jgi:hypothetical protein
MKYEEFRAFAVQMPVIDNNTLKLRGVFSRSNHIQFSRWVKKGYVLRLKKGGLYILREEDRKINPSRMFLGCEMYKPSYISLEYALGYYGLIPERVHDLTCVTTQKTNRFENSFGTFVYQHIKSACFTGFEERVDESRLTYVIAKPEKAMVDFLYLNLAQFNINDNNKFIESFRFQNLESLDHDVLRKFARLFGVKKLEQVTELMITVAKEGVHD